MKKFIIIVERDSSDEINGVAKLLTDNKVDFIFCPVVENEIVKETKNFFWKIVDKFGGKG